jgi:heterodisulfide reductase subunit B
MNGKNNSEYSYFPGCSVVTTAWESNQSLMRACQTLGFNLVELDDWNCCGSSSAFAIDPQRHTRS